MVRYKKQKTIRISYGLGITVYQIVGTKRVTNRNRDTIQETATIVNTTVKSINK